MCSYQRVNNSYGCANSKTQNGLLKTELGFQVLCDSPPETPCRGSPPELTVWQGYLTTIRFQGFIVSDWDAQHAGVATTLAGLDMAMPDDQGFWGGKLVDAVKNGSIPEARVDDMAVRYVCSIRDRDIQILKHSQNPGVVVPVWARQRFSRARNRHAQGGDGAS